MLYLLNSALIPTRGDKFVAIIQPLDKTSASKMLKRGFVSAVGHQATADFLTKLFGVYVPCERRTITLQDGDQAIRLCLKQRLPEGVILSEKELEKVEYTLDLVTIPSGKAQWQMLTSTDELLP